MKIGTAPISALMHMVFKFSDLRVGYTMVIVSALGKTKSNIENLMGHQLKSVVGTISVRLTQKPILQQECKLSGEGRR